MWVGVSLFRIVYLLTDDDGDNGGGNNKLLLIYNRCIIRITVITNRVVNTTRVN